MIIKVWCYKCKKHIKSAYLYSRIFECSECGYEIMVEIKKEKEFYIK